MYEGNSRAYFVQGDYACAEGAIAAGCRFFSFYPITPASEIAEVLAERLPAVGGIFIQMEDEIASIHAACGAAVGGVKAMTGSSGPGISLKMDGLGWAIKNEVPLVIVDVMRAGPSNGVATSVGQGDFYQARYGTHGGNYELIVLSPTTVQEAFDLTIEAFNLAEIYRCPVIFLMDEAVGHTREKLVIPSEEELSTRVFERRTPEQLDGYNSFSHLFTPEANNVPFPVAGYGYGICFSPYTHDERGYPNASVKYQDLMAKRLVHKIRFHVDEIVKMDSAFMDDADVAIVSYGCTARSAYSAAYQLRDEGLKIGYIKLVTLWPFPDRQIRELTKKVDKIFVAECNIDGQLVREVQRAARTEVDVIHIGHGGVDFSTPKQIISAIRRMVKVQDGGP